MYKQLKKPKNILKITLTIFALLLVSTILPFSSYVEADYSGEDEYQLQSEVNEADNEIIEIDDETVESGDRTVESEPLDTPINLVLNRGHIEELSFGGPMGLSWTEVNNRETFTVFAFRNAYSQSPNEAHAYVDEIDALHLNVNTAFSFDIGEGPFWFRVQAVADDLVYSNLSEPIGPFWYSYHSDAYQFYPQGRLEIFNDPEIPVIILDLRRPIEREAQGNILGDVHIPWPNAAAVDEGITHADFQNAVITAWENFIANDLTDAQRANLNPELDFRDIHIFVF